MFSCSTVGLLQHCMQKATVSFYSTVHSYLASIVREAICITISYILYMFTVFLFSIYLGKELSYTRTYQAVLNSSAVGSYLACTSCNLLSFIVHGPSYFFLLRSRFPSITYSTVILYSEPCRLSGSKWERPELNLLVMTV